MIKFNFWKKESDEHEFWVWIKDKWKDDKNFLDKYFTNENSKQWFFKKRQMQLEDLNTMQNLKDDFYEKYKNNERENIDLKRKNRKILKKWFTHFIKEKDIKSLLRKVSVFWGSTDLKGEEITIILYKKYKKTSSGLAASAIKGIESKTIITSFNAEINTDSLSQKITFLSAFFHELSHLIQYKDKNHLVTVFKKEFKNRNFDIKKQDIWWDRVLESINSSISHFNLGVFLEEYYSITELRSIKKDRWKILNPKKTEGQALYLAVAYKILPETRKYFREGKKIDEKYIKKVFDYYQEFCEKLNKKK